MTKPPARPPGTPCWIDLLTPDADRARRFYGELFGWNGLAASAEFGGYFLFELDGVPVAGCMPVTPETPEWATPGWGTYLAVEDVRQSVEVTSGAGAAVIQPALDIADLGGSAIVADPGGAVVGLWQTRTFAGFRTGGPGTPPGAPAYFELHTRDYDSAVPFYRDILGWNAVERTEVPGLRYTTLGDGASQAGIMDATGFLAEGEPAAWSVYFATADVDASAARVRHLGGDVLAPSMDTPFGRQATVADPAGARFKLLGPAAG